MSPSSLLDSCWLENWQTSPYSIPLSIHWKTNSMNACLCLCDATPIKYSVSCVLQNPCFQTENTNCSNNWDRAPFGTCPSGHGQNTTITLSKWWNNNAGPETSKEHAWACGAIDDPLVSHWVCGWTFPMRENVPLNKEKIPPIWPDWHLFHPTFPFHPTLQ